MDFARKQLEKYGWSDGKGLGKHENGISEALKPKLKRSVAGIGYDAGADFTEHWWSALYDKAAGNVQVEEENGKTKKMKRKEDKEFEITNSTWRLKKKDNGKNSEEYSDFFVRTAVLGSGGSKTTKVRDSSDSEEEMSKDVVKMTDEELFAACEGRTAHKGARHGLRALGKLARIEQQEQLLLQQAKYNNFLAKNKNNNEQIVEDASLEDIQINKKKKKKKKRCNSNDNNDKMINENTFNESNENCETFNKNEDKVVENEESTQIDNCSDDVQISKKKKKKKKSYNSNENEYNQNVINENTSNECNEKSDTSSKSENLVDNEENTKKKSKKSKRKDNEDSNEFISNIDISNESESVLKPKKKRKHINSDINEGSKSETQLQAEEISKSKKKKKK